MVKEVVSTLPLKTGFGPVVGSKGDIQKTSRKADVDPGRSQSHD